MDGPDASRLHPIGLLLRNRAERALFQEVIAEIGATVALLRPSLPEAEWPELSLLLVDEAAAPGLSAAVAQAKRRWSPAFLPALVVSSRFGSGTRWISEGFDDVLRLPLSRDELLYRLELHLRLRARSRATERMIFESVPTGLFRADGDGAILAANPAMVRLMEAESLDLLQRAGPILGERGFPPLLVTSPLPGMAEGTGVESPWFREKGILWLRWSWKSRLTAEGRFLHYEGGVEDISHRRRAEAALERTQALLTATVDSVPALVAVLDREGRILRVNRAWRERAAAEAPSGDPDVGIGQPYLEVVEALGTGPAEGSSEVADALASILSLGSSRFTLDYRPLRRPDLWHRLEIAPLRGGEGGAVVMHVDTTTEKRAQEVLRVRQEELRRSEKTEAVARLAGGIAHDFNNLLTTIRGNAEQLSTTLPLGSEEGIEAAEIRDASRRAAELTRLLLVLSGTQVSPLPTPLLLGSSIDGLVAELRDSLPAKVTLLWEVPTDDVPVAISREELAVILRNLVENSTEAMGSAGGMISISMAPAILPGRGGEGAGREGIELRVRDTGPGIAAGILDRVFEVFVSTRGKGVQAGLGLALVQRTVDRLGGRIRAENMPGRGALLRIHLPLAEIGDPATSSSPAASRKEVRADEPGPAASPVPLASPQSSPPSGSSSATTSEAPKEGAPLVILLVEDDEMVRTPTERLLTRLGYRVHSAANGAEGLAYLREEGSRVDLVISDVVMPKMTGPEMIRTFRADTGMDPKVLFISGYTEREVEFFREGIADGRCRLLEKPFDFSSLARAVRESLGIAPSPP